MTAVMIADLPKYRTIDGPGAALKLHLDSLAWIRSPQCTRMIIRGTSAFQQLSKADPQVALAYGQFLYRSAVSLLDSAPTYYVAPPICELVEAAAQLAEPEPLFPTDLIEPEGIAIFARPFVLNEPDGLFTGPPEAQHPLWTLRGISWRTATVDCKTDPDQTPLDGKQDMREGIELIAWVSKLDGAALYGFEPPAVDALVPLEITGWAFGAGWKRSDSCEGFTAAEQSASVSDTRVRLLALLRLLWQEILVPDTFGPDRGLRRRSESIRRRRWEDGGIKVVRLRHVHRDDDSEATVDDGNGGRRLNHRVIVRGHWRRQHYRSLGPVGDDAAYRLIWIAPHVRGPEDAPLVLRHNVTAVVR